MELMTFSMVVAAGAQDRHSPTGKSYVAPTGLLAWVALPAPAPEPKPDGFFADQP